MRIAIFDRFLSKARPYQWFQDLIGGTRAREWTLARYVPVQHGQSILDLGCGPGDLLRLLPKMVDFDYLGLDISESYLAQARRRQTRTVRFERGDCTNFYDQLGNRRFDWILCMGLLHHLDDEQCNSLLSQAASSLKPHGSVICLEPTFFPQQNWITRQVMKQDRGRFVRSDLEWIALFAKWFVEVQLHPLEGAFRIPYQKAVAILRDPRID